MCHRHTCSLDTPLRDVETSVPELLILTLDVLLRRICPRLSRSQATGWMTGCLSPAKIMAVRRAGSGLASSDGIPESFGGLEESQNAGDTKTTWPCDKRQSDTHEKMTKGKKHKIRTNLYNAKGHSTKKQCEPNIPREHAPAYLNTIDCHH